MFSIDHYISPCGATIVSKKVANYIKITSNTARDNSEKLFIENKDMLFLHHPEDFDEDFNEFSVYKFPASIIREAGNNDPPQKYTGISKSSDICIMGDCNLQAYMYDGAGITANLSYYLNYPVQYIGRLLPFSSHNPITREAINNMLNKKIVIYVAFSSASFVRPSLINRYTIKHPIKATQWSTLDLSSI